MHFSAADVQTIKRYVMWGIWLWKKWIGYIVKKNV
jgi:hypothetical protein